MQFPPDPAETAPPPDPPELWYPEPPAPPRRRLATAWLAIVLVLASTVSLATILPAALHRDSGQDTLGSLFSGGSGPLDATAIASKVSPALVDVTARFPDGLAAGTGMILTSSGQVLTNNHVIDGAYAIETQVGGTGQVFSAHLVGADPSSDIALLQIDGASGLPTVRLGDSTAAKVGEPVVAIGNALGRAGPPAASQGRITALDQTITASDQGGLSAETLGGLIQVDADVVPGDSGGPLVDGAGKVIGMDTAASARGVRLRTGASQGFAIPIATAMSVAKGLRSGHGATASTPLPVATARLGVALDNSADGTGAAVTGVQPGSPAEFAGIAAGDVIVGIDGRPARAAAVLRAAIRAHRPGDRITVNWVDGAGASHEASVQLAAATG